MRSILRRILRETSVIVMAAILVVTFMPIGDGLDLGVKTYAESSKTIAGVQNTTVKLTGQIYDDWPVLKWTKSKGYRVDYYDVHRSIKKSSGYGTKAYERLNNSFSWYDNIYDTVKGTTYYYKVRGVRVINGKEYYTKWSNKVSIKAETTRLTQEEEIAKKNTVSDTSTSTKKTDTTDTEETKVKVTDEYPKEVQYDEDGDIVQLGVGTTMEENIAWIEETQEVIEKGTVPATSRYYTEGTLYWVFKTTDGRTWIYNKLSDDGASSLGELYLDYNYEDWNKEMLELVNAERIKAGVEPLKLNTELMKAAMARAEELFVKYSHTRPDGTRFNTIFGNYDIVYDAAGENLGAGISPEDAFEGWMNSPGHKTNILYPSYKECGFGFAKGWKYDTNYLAIQDFIW